MSSRTIQLLICDDDENFQLSAKQALKGKCQVKSARHSDEAIAILKNHAIDILLLDVDMRTSSEGVRAIPALKRIAPEVSIIMSSGRTDFETVRESMRLGAVDYAPKGTEPEALWHVIGRVIEQRRRLKNVSGQKDFEARESQKRHELHRAEPADLSFTEADREVQGESRERGHSRRDRYRKRSHRPNAEANASR